MRLSTLLSLFALGTLLLPTSMASPANGTYQYCVPNDTNTVIAPDTEEEEIEGDDDTPSSLSSPTSRDTLRTYTLNGMCVKGAAKSQPTRTLYNIIIKNGRKVLKR